MASTIDGRMLVWGGYLDSSAPRADKSNRWLICVNTTKQLLRVVQHEDEHHVFAFKSLMCVFANLKFENALMVFFNNGKAPLQIFLDSVNDRVAMQRLLSSIPKGEYRRAALAVGARAEAQFAVSKKGKLGWASRSLAVVKNRVLIFRHKSKSEFPLNMISLLEPSIHICVSKSHERCLEIQCQERKFVLRMKNTEAVCVLVKALQRQRDRMNAEAKYAQMKEIKQMSESIRLHQSEGILVRQRLTSTAALTSTRFLKIQESAAAATSERETIRLVSGSTMTLAIDSSSADAKRIVMVPRSKQLAKAQRRLPFEKSFKPDTQHSSIFLWGKARPPRLYPMHSDQIQPFRHEEMSKKRFIYIAAAKDGCHALGFAQNDWTFVWGENNETPAALGLGRDVKSTIPFLISGLRKKRVIQVCCSASHGLALSADATVYGWGLKSMTHLPAPTNTPKPLPFLSALGTTAIACSSTHSCAYSGANSDVFMWGMPGPWLGFEDDSGAKTFGRVDFHESIADDKRLTVSKVELGPQYSLILLSDGMLLATGRNQFGRMGVGKDVAATWKPVFVENVPLFCDLSAGPFHASFLSRAGQVFSCGLGTDFRLGHGDEDTVWVPTQVRSLKEVKIVRVECVAQRTLAITKHGCVLIWGVETVKGLVYTKPFVYEYLRPFRIYQVSGAKDFTVALGVYSKSPVPKPEIEVCEPRQKYSAIKDITDIFAGSDLADAGDFAVVAMAGAQMIVSKTVRETAATGGMGKAVPMRSAMRGSSNSGFATMEAMRERPMPPPPPPMFAGASATVVTPIIRRVPDKRSMAALSSVTMPGPPSPSPPSSGFYHSPECRPAEVGFVDGDAGHVSVPSTGGLPPPNPEPAFYRALPRPLSSDSESDSSELK